MSLRKPSHIFPLRVAYVYSSVIMGKRIFPKIVISETAVEMTLFVETSKRIFPKIVISETAVEMTLFVETSFFFCTVLCILNHILVSTPTRFGIQPMPSSGSSVLLYFLVKTSQWRFHISDTGVTKSTNYPSVK